LFSFVVPSGVTEFIRFVFASLSLAFIKLAFAFSGDLDKITNRADASASLMKARLNDAKTNLMNSVTPEGTTNENEDMFSALTEDMES
jgi:hypothetical protein